MRVVSSRKMCALAACGVFGVIAAYTVSAIRESVEAEQNLRAMVVALRAVNEFVKEERKWPNSWQEVRLFLRDRKSGEGIDEMEWTRFEVEERIWIDARVDLCELYTQDPREFGAIAPKGPCYESYRRYGHIEQLQHTVGTLHPCD